MYFENAENINENHCSNAMIFKCGSAKGQENVLLCANFQESLHLDFGKVPLKGSKTICFTLKNPSISKPVQISTAHASKVGITVSIENAVNNAVSIQPLESCNALLSWTPIADCMLREIIRFKMDDRGSLQVIAEGLAGCGKEEAPKKRQSLDNTSLKAPLKKATAPARQSLLVVPVSKHEPAAVKDVQWVEKQATTFVDWMNFKFADSQVTSTAVESTLNSVDPSPISDLTRKQNEARIKQEASLVFKSSDFQSMIQLIESEVSQGKLQLREDRDILQDLGLQEAFFGILFSYELTWLTLGLEVITGKVMKQRFQENGSAKAKAQVKAYVMEQLFNNPTIVAKFPTQSGLYLSQERKLKLQLKKHLLFHFLALVLFLDRGRSVCVLPLKSLFVRESIYKSSKDVLISFCRCFLHGEGDIIKHLGLIGYHVHFTQTYIDEINYTVSNLATDLRDGVRLALLLDILTRTNSVTSQLRVPAVSRLQKLHNVSAVLKQLFPEGSNSMIESKHIVDGNRDKTLYLLWNIMYTFELRTILSCEQIDAEVRTINSVPTAEAPAATTRDSSDIVASLLAWCNAIAAPHGVSVKNLTSSLVDGKALCLVISHYHPSLMSNSNEAVQEAILKESKHISEQRRNFNAILRACKSIGGIPPLLYELDSRVDEKTMLIFLGHLFVRLTESAKQVEASTKLQRFFRVKRSKIIKQYNPAAPPASAFSVSLAAAEPITVPRKRRDTFPEHTVVWNEASRISLAFNTESATNVAVESVTDDVYVELKSAAVAPASEIAESYPISCEAIAVASDICSDDQLIEMKEELKIDLQTKIQTEKHLLDSVAAQLEDSEAREAATIAAARVEVEQAAALAAAEEAIRQKKEAERAAALASALAEKEAQALQALLMAESCLKSESEARQALEMRVRAEVEARLALEQRLMLIEKQNQDLVSSMKRKEVMAKLAEFAKRRSVRVILCYWRAYRSWKSQQRALRGTVKLQAMVRRAIAQRRYLCLLLAIQILQSSWRRKRCARLLVTMESRAAIIQRVWKRHYEHALTVKREKSATKLASWWRSALQSTSFKALRSATILCQSMVRTHRTKKQYTSALQSINRIQSFFRKCLSKKFTASRKKGARVLQRAYAAFKFRTSVAAAFNAQRLTKSRQQLHERQCREKIFGFVQAVLSKRKRIAAVTAISKWFIARLPLIRARKLINGFRRLIAVHRANVIRKQNSCNAALTFSLKRIREAEMRCQLTPALRLGNLTAKALQSLCVGTIISDLLKSCQVLEMATEYSEECSAMFVTAKKVDILFGLLRSCNRSESHQELLRTVLVVLLHIARVRHLASAVGESCEVVDSLVDLLQMFRDKKFLFKLACELLIRFVRASPGVKNTCMSLVVFKRLEGIHHIMERKDRLESRLRSIDSRSGSSLGYHCSSSSSAANCRRSLELAEPILYIQHLMSLLQE